MGELNPDTSEPTWHDPNEDAPLTERDIIGWIRVLRSRTHRTGNFTQSLQGEILLERMRIDEALKDIGRNEARQEKTNEDVEVLKSWQSMTKGALAVVVLLFPTTVGVIVAILKNGGN